MINASDHNYLHGTSTAALSSKTGKSNGCKHYDPLVDLLTHYGSRKLFLVSLLWLFFNAISHFPHRVEDRGTIMLE